MICPWLVRLRKSMHQREKWFKFLEQRDLGIILLNSSEFFYALAANLSPGVVSCFPLMEPGILCLRCILFSSCSRKSTREFSLIFSHIVSLSKNRRRTGYENLSAWGSGHFLSSGGGEVFCCVTIKFTWSPLKLCSILMPPPPIGSKFPVASTLYSVSNWSPLHSL